MICMSVLFEHAREASCVPIGRGLCSQSPEDVTERVGLHTLVPAHSYVHAWCRQAYSCNRQCLSSSKAPLLTTHLNAGLCSLLVLLTHILDHEAYMCLNILACANVYGGTPTCEHALFPCYQEHAYISPYPLKLIRTSECERG